MDQLQSAPRWRRLLFRFAVHVGWERFEWHQHRRRWSPSFLLWPFLDPLIGGRVRARLGGRLRLVVSGGAALPLSVARVFVGLGLPVLQGYGLTETSPQVSVNRLHDNDPASVGRPLPGIEVRIGPQEELLVRSPGIMHGYWKNPEATAATIREGWLHTGDQARLHDGRIYITGRLKDVLVLSNGEKVPPAEMELAITLEPLVEQVMIAGEGRAFLTALVVLSHDHWAEFARQLGVDPAAPASLTDKRVQHELLVRIGRRLHGFPTWAKVRRVLLSLEPWTVENGLLTPTLKIKRAAVLAQFQDALDRLYEQGYPE
jgi:long-chain acyl-CoA synthetase